MSKETLSDRVRRGNTTGLEDCLVDAAPDLLAAAQAMIVKLDSMTTEQFIRGEDRAAREQLTAAIRKAKGEA